MPHKNSEQEDNNDSGRLGNIYDQLKTTIFTSVRRRNKEDTGFLIFLGIALISIAIAFVYFFLNRLDL